MGEVSVVSRKAQPRADDMPRGNLPALGCALRLIESSAQHRLEPLLGFVLLPLAAPLEEPPPLVAEAALMILHQRLDSLAKSGRLVRQRPLESRPDLAEPADGDEAVVGVAEDFLHCLDLGIDVVLELVIEAR